MLDLPAQKEPIRARLECRPLADQVVPATLLDALAGQPYPVMLESSAVDVRYGRYTVVACRPLEIITLRDGRLTDSAGREFCPSRPLEGLRRALESVRCQGQSPLPYGPGWIGYVGYEFGRWLERLPGRAVRDTNLPDVHLAFYDAAAVYDAIERRWHLAELELGRPARSDSAGQVLREMIGSSGGSPPRAGPPSTTPLPATSNFTPEAYRRAVARCIEYIAAGDIFQGTLSQRFTVPEAPAPLAIYRALRRRNPAWYSAMLLLGPGPPWEAGQAVLSSSPELFLRLRGGEVLTRPIKGTRPRVGRPAADAAAAEDLLASEKDNAELAMIIDLLRNDLGRVCQYGSVGVVNRRELEVHPTVFHLVGSVAGQLRPGLGAFDLLAATFPGGSITGAPKIRAMEIIDELEPVARGPYTGSVGWFGTNGDCELNIVIRTIVYDRGKAHVQVGGGIVADSTPQGEYQETLDKARALLEALAAAKHTL
jgi:para-aminobenzoate synthetase component 1